MPSISRFVSDLKLDKADESSLVRHIQDCHANAGDPSLQDRCTDRIRKYLQQNPPPDLSWHGNIKLDDELNAGFTSKQAYKMGIPAIGIVAVLVANVTFSAWQSPPGGPTPYWAGCDYPMFTSFLIVNGVAFMLSVASFIVVTAFPLLLKRTPHQAAWWGGILLLMAMIAFIGAVLLAGFVTVSYKAPNPGCASLMCDDGGIRCVTYASNQVYADVGVYGLDPNVAALNNLVPLGNGSAAICLQYNVSVATSATTTTLYPAMPECPGSSVDTTEAQWDSCPDVRQLLENATVQQQVVCMPQVSFPQILPTTDYDTFSIPINASALSPYTSLTAFYQGAPTNYITDLIAPQGTSNALVPYAGFTYMCHSKGDDKKVSFDTLCDTSQYPLLSVTRAGQYMTEFTASANGATVFHADAISTQVATAIEALSAFFGLVLLIIIIYLVRSKTKYD